MNEGRTNENDELSFQHSLFNSHDCDAFIRQDFQPPSPFLSTDTFPVPENAASSEMPVSNVPPTIFLSKDDPFPIPSVSEFDHKNMASNTFTSIDWDLQKVFDGYRSSRSAASDDEEQVSEKAAVPIKEEPKDIFSSYDALMATNLVAGAVPSASAFPSASASASSRTKKTDWAGMFQSQLGPAYSPMDERQGPQEALSPQAVPSSEAAIESSDVAGSFDAIPSAGTPSTNNSTENTTQSNTTDTTDTPKKRKRKRKPRQKVVPEVKEYVEPTEKDVLLGRGGRSNNHPGNKRYRAEVQNLKSWYLGTSDKDEKTDLSQCLVDYIHSYEGRFLEKDETGWYKVPNIVARRKASQALREDNDAEKRAAKRSRFLQKREALKKQQVDVADNAQVESV